MTGMKEACGKLGWLALRGLIGLAQAPTIMAINLVRLWAARPLLGDSTTCPTCGTEIALLGHWQCGRCGYSWYGWYFMRCEVCGDVPPYLTCNRCGASMMNPLLFE